MGRKSNSESGPATAVSRSDRRHRAKDLRCHNEHELRALADDLPDIVARWDRQLCPIYINRAFERTTGQSADAFLGKPLGDAGLPLDLVHLWQEKLGDVLCNAREQTLEFFWPSTDGPHRLDSRLLPEIASDGSVESVLSITHDFNEQLNGSQRTAWRPSELARLNHLSNFEALAAGMAHEINQPLHAIKNFVQASINVLEKTSGNERLLLKAWQEQVLEQTDRAIQLIRLAMGFVQKHPAKYAALDINHVVRETLPLMKFEFAAHQIRLESELTEDPPAVLADDVQVQQILINLLRNAVEALSEQANDHRLIKLSTAIVDGGIQVSVCDNGPGFCVDSNHLLFEPFFSTKPDRLGLGLAVCQSIVQAHCGQLGAELNSDRGSTFRFLLPAYLEGPQDVHCHT